MIEVLTKYQEEITLQCDESGCIGGCLRPAVGAEGTAIAAEGAVAQGRCEQPIKDKISSCLASLTILSSRSAKLKGA
jgi:hypothetical protein